MVPQVEQIKKDYEIIFLCKFGSHLYGTNTPTSDTDYKGIYVPSFEDCIQGKIKKSINFDTNNTDEKNTSDDIDCEIYSIQHFFQLATRGETVAIDMLHCNEECTVFSTRKWDYIQDRRHLFYSKNMTAFIGYAQKQAAKYGLKGSRIAAGKTLLNYLNQAPDLSAKMLSVWDGLPTDTHMTHLITEPKEIRKFNFCGKQLQETIKISYAIEIVEKFLKSYGERAQQAEKNEGVDWKAISHALRAAYQLEEIYTFKDLTFPLLTADYLREVKEGKHDFKKVLINLETQIATVKILAEHCSFPEHADPNQAFRILQRIYRTSYV